jgi:hypothetical protein
MKVRASAVLSAIVLVLAISASALAAPVTYSIRDLGTIGGSLS